MRESQSDVTRWFLDKVYSMSSVFLLGALPLVIAVPHGDQMTAQNVTASAMGGMHMEPLEMSESFKFPNYFRHPEMATWMYGHIAAMVVSWCIVLPLSKLIREIDDYNSDH
jgi:hypothetical protein